MQKENGVDNGLRARRGRRQRSAGGPSKVLASKLGRLRGHGVTWSPDGQEIAFTAGDRIWRVTRGAGEPKQVRTGLPGTPGQLDWSCDGKRLVFEFDAGRHAELWLMASYR